MGEICLSVFKAICHLICTGISINSEFAESSDC